MRRRRLGCDREQTGLRAAGLRAVHSLCLLGLLPNWSLKAKCSCRQATRPPTEAISSEEAPNIRPCLEMPCSVQQALLSTYSIYQVVLVVKNPPVNVEDVRDMGLIPGSGRSSGGGYGSPVQYSCLENPMDRGAWLFIGSQSFGHD